jgi:hypothetical protein
MAMYEAMKRLKSVRSALAKQYGGPVKCRYRLPPQAGLHPPEKRGGLSSPFQYQVAIRALPVAGLFYHLDNKPPRLCCRPLDKMDHVAVANLRTISSVSHVMLTTYAPEYGRPPGAQSLKPSQAENCCCLVRHRGRVFSSWLMVSGWEYAHEPLLISCARSRATHLAG